MILCIGEILADLIAEDAGGKIKYSQFAGGAPFNVCVNAMQAGARAAFIGRVGHDPIGRFLTDYTSHAGFARADIQIDPVRNTTLAIVSLRDGERDFAFFRHDTADFNIDPGQIDLASYDGLNIVALGTLMLSEERGREIAHEIVAKVRSARKILAIDVNFRMDLFPSMDALKASFKPFVDEADILKFGDDEILDYTGADDVQTAARMLAKPGRLILVTLGARGSMYFYENISGVIPTAKVKPIDTTGAGDAFFGATLAGLEGKEMTKENIERALEAGNKAGARATQFKGAIQL